MDDYRLPYPEDRVVLDTCDKSYSHTGPSGAAGWESWPVVDPRDFGAAADGATLDTPAIQKAIDAAASRGGGRVRLAGGTYVSGSIFLKPRAALVIEGDGILKATEDDEAYPIVLTRAAGVEMPWPAGLVNADNMHGVRIVGPGRIDGSGWKWWRRYWATGEQFRREMPDTPNRRDGVYIDWCVGRPRPLIVTRSRDVLIDGLSILDSAFWTVHIIYSSEVEVRGLAIRNFHDELWSPSTDGIDIDSCRNVEVHHCDIDCHDDCVVLKSGLSADGERVGIPTENVLVHDCLTRHGDAMVACGTDIAAGVRNVTVRDCRAVGTSAGIRIKSRDDRGGFVENVSCERITMTDVASPIQFRINHRVEPDEAIHWKLRRPRSGGVPRMRNFSYREISCTGAERCIDVREDPRGWFENVHLEKVRLEGRYGARILRASNWSLSDVDISCREGPAFRVSDSRNVTRDGHALQG